MKKRNFSVLILAILLLITTPLRDVQAEEGKTRTTEADVTFTRGPGSVLRIQTAPKDFIFGSEVIEHNNDNFILGNDSDREVIVHDYRGTGDGWALTAKLDEFEKNSTEVINYDSPLKGAKIVLKNGEVAERTYDNNPILVPEEIYLSAGGPPTLITSATVGSGLGVTSVNWGNEHASISLEVPEETRTIGGYSANITWTLENTPQAEN